VSRVPETRSGKVRLWDGAIPGTHEPGFVEEPIREFDSGGALDPLKGKVDFLATFAMGECHLILSRELGRWHLSISREDRHPSWDEIKTARYRLLGPDLTMAMILPKAERYVNVPMQDHVFQLWQLLAEEDGW
jgi:hypothetical protein